LAVRAAGAAGAAGRAEAVALRNGWVDFQRVKGGLVSALRAENPCGFLPAGCWRQKPWSLIAGPRFWDSWRAGRVAR